MTIFTIDVTKTSRTKK